jgi:hypothetical protein
MTSVAEFILTRYSVGHNYVNTFISSVAGSNTTSQENVFEISVVKIKA